MRRKSKSFTLGFERKAKRIIRSFRFDKKAASPVVSTLILTAGVIAMSIAVLYWTYSMGKIGNLEYSKSTAASSNAISERIGFEYMTYDSSSGNLTVSIINWGKADNVIIAHVLILDSSYNYVGSNISTIVLKSIDNNQPVSGLRIGSDAWFTTRTSAPLNQDQIYYIHISTSRGRNFDFPFSWSP